LRALLDLPGLVETKVLLDAIGDGLSLLTWEQDTLAYADSYDGTSGRYRGLRYGQRVTLTHISTGMLVSPRRHLGKSLPRLLHGVRVNCLRSWR
jgi:hypothetical protein